MIMEWLKRWRGEWWLEGWDTFGSHSYPIAGWYRTKEAATRAARRQLAKLEKQQPTSSSGGRGGIQDHVYVRGPNGESIRIRD
ncbi:MAG: hypothetical protein CBC34_008345 [Hyphomicrobiaceae bacterium TMED74]|nr:hypothetical protein [Filomicrobium sp.]RPG42242.1 MAG: hypothetical protein CBC34_008345 [Hyphomicrobiaceae bacterium TMED74]